MGTSYRRWAQQLVVAAQDPERERELDLWTGMLTSAEPRLTDRPTDPGAPGASGTLRRTLPQRSTEPLLGRVPAAFNCDVDDVLLTAFALAVAHWRRRHLRDHRGGTSILLDLERDGREPFADGQDLTRTLGWLATEHPLRLDPGTVDWAELTAGGPAVGTAIKAVKEQLRSVPDHGIGYGMLRHLNPRTAPVLAGLPRPAIGFGYLGRLDTTELAEWPVSAGSAESLQAPDPGPRTGHALEVTALVTDGPDGPCLVLACTWATDLFDETAVRDLADDWLRALEALAAHAGAAGVGGHTPSDLSLVGLDQDDIDVLEADGRFFSS